MEFVEMKGQAVKTKRETQAKYASTIIRLCHKEYFEWILTQESMPWGTQQVFIYWLTS